MKDAFIKRFDARFNVVGEDFEHLLCDYDQYNWYSYGILLKSWMVRRLLEGHVDFFVFIGMFNVVKVPIGTSIWAQEYIE